MYIVHYRLLSDYHGDHHELNILYLIYDIAIIKEKIGIDIQCLVRENN